MATVEQVPFIAAGTMLMTLQPMLVKLSQNAEGKIEYNTSSNVLVSEALKFVISGCLYVGDQRQPKGQMRLREFLEYAVPGLIYFVNNNLNFLILMYVDATTFQLLSQLKTVFTALLFRYFLGHQLSFYQYLAIWQLACGSAVSQIPVSGDHSREESRSSLLGFCFAAFSCLLSASGGIYSEKLLKDKAKDSLHWQNMQLYTWGIVLNVISMLASDYSTILQDGVFKGYNGWTWAVTLNNALNGLAISAILKYADNIARVYAHACAMLLTMLLSTLFFQTPITPKLVLAVAVVSSSAFQYNVKPEHLGFDALPTTPKYEKLEDASPLVAAGPVESRDGAASEPCVSESKENLLQEMRTMAIAPGGQTD
eukprot:TRINITY_DN18284_c0_g1_i1.p1 TRINITY_DN18284_c0_g1~~TRINITY_DN18284_c0_g1_i1.p1  ORF type:complete len:368 (+),score=84.06 TRINITY_DN18284_c0_g1_i1:136-1239(+)